MTSLSELIGFIVISVYPSDVKISSRIRRPLRRHKSDDGLLADSDDLQEGRGSDEETTSLTINHRQYNSPEQCGIVYRAKSPERPKGPAHRMPDFWIIVVVMSMRTSPGSPYLLYLVSGCGLMYINV